MQPSNSLIPFSDVPDVVKETGVCVRSKRSPGNYVLTPELSRALSDFEAPDQSSSVLVLLDMRTFCYPMISALASKVKRLSERGVSLKVSEFEAFMMMWEQRLTKLDETVKDWAIKVTGIDNPAIKLILCDDAPEKRVIDGEERVYYWRTGVVPQYKAGRKNKPDNWGVVTKAAYMVAQNLDIPIVRECLMEADDMIAQFVRDRHSYGEQGVKGVCIITVDTDLMQLVTEDDDQVPVVWFNYPYAPCLRDFETSLAYWKKRWKATIGHPREIAAYKAENGDRSDNLEPGSPIGVIDLLEPGLRPMGDYSAAVENPGYQMDKLTKLHEVASIDLLYNSLPLL